MGVPYTEDWFSFTIRRNRKSFIFANMLLVGIMFAVLLALWFFSVREELRWLILLVFFVPYAVCGYSLSAQRLRDMNLTGWLALLWIPIGVADSYIGGAASLAFAIVLSVVPGTRGTNSFGPDPVA